MIFFIEKLDLSLIVFFSNELIGDPGWKKNKFFSDACVLVSTEAKHRVLIIPKTGSDYKYGLFSCSINKKPYCEFETNSEF